MCGVGWKRQLTINSPTALPNSGLAYAQVTGGTVMAGAQSTLPTGPWRVFSWSTRSVSETWPGPLLDCGAPPTQRQHTHTRGRGAQALLPTASHRVPSNRPAGGWSLLWAQGSTPTGGAWTLGGQGWGGQGSRGAVR